MQPATDCNRKRSVTLLPTSANVVLIRASTRRLSFAVDRDKKINEVKMQCLQQKEDNDLPKITSGNYSVIGYFHTN
jgi:hypothetical protein